MKKILLFLFIGTNVLFGQADVELRLVNDTNGSPQYGEYFIANSSNNDGLNAILAAHNVFSYIHKGGHPYEPYSNRMISILCTNCDQNQLISDLSAYSAVVEHAVASNQDRFKDAALLQLNNLTNGIPTGSTGGIVVTNDTGLNQIFQDFNVFHYAQTFPFSTTDPLLRFFNVICNCDADALRAALENYDAVVNYTEPAGAGYLLSSDEFESNPATLYPNPFSTSFSIETNETISNYQLYDVFGKLLVDTHSKNDLDSTASQLNSGIYILNLQFEDGKTANYKLVKK